MGNVVPVMKFASFDPRNVAKRATSATSPMRPSGMAAQHQSKYCKEK
jgi:hypothetical protein